jgi:hypothetical protein
MTGPQLPQQHDDPFGDARSQMIQALAVLTTVGEAAARWAVAGAQNRAQRAEQALRAQRLQDDAAQQADRATAQAQAEADQAARALMDQAFDRRWLDRAGIHEVAQVWRTAAMYAASGDERATQAMRRAHERLRVLHPGLMDAYDRHRAAGMNLASAMQAAVHEVWTAEARHRGAGRARPHGATGDPDPRLRAGANGRAIASAPDPFGMRLADELDAAVRAEIARLAIDVNPELLDRVQRQWRSAGHAPAADAATLLAQFARDLRGFAPDVVVAELEAAAHRAAADALTTRANAADRAGQFDRATPDDPTTAPDEHQAGVATATGRHSGAEHERAGADQQARLGRAFPPLRRIDPSTRPTPAAAPAAQPGRTQRKGSIR